MTLTFVTAFTQCDHKSCLQHARFQPHSDMSAHSTSRASNTHAHAHSHARTYIRRLGCETDVPYGARLRWTLPNGMPLYVHLKNKEFVATKKRWSQVCVRRGLAQRIEVVLVFSACALGAVDARPLLGQAPSSAHSILGIGPVSHVSSLTTDYR